MLQLINMLKSQQISEEIDMKVMKYLRGEGANLEVCAGDLVFIMLVNQFLS